MNFIDYLFEHSRYLGKDFILGKSGTIAYHELYRQVAVVSRCLRDRIGEDRNVVLMADNSIFFIIAYFGIMHSGNSVVPLDPSVSSNALTHIIQSCETPLVFVQKRSRMKFESFGGTVIDEEALTGIIAQCSDMGEKSQKTGIREFDENRLAQLIFTSGSTALPKGVMLSHKNLIANTMSIISYLGIDENDIMLVVLPFFYCYGLSLLHTHVRAGGALAINNKFIFLQDVINDLNKYKCTGFAGVPSHFQILLRKSPTFKETVFPHLIYVTQAGGKLPDAFIDEFTTAFPQIKFYVMYGQTEATARLSYLPPDMLHTKRGSMGKGIPGVTLEVLDLEGNPVKPGEVGEVVASGGNIMRGYYQDDELTARTVRNGRLYTGDLATVDEDGYIFIVAREKEILKVGGERVSPKEVEEVIDSIPGVIDSSVIGVQDEVLGEAIKAYVVLNKDTRETVTENYIRSYCGTKLSFQKVPKFIEFIDRIPVNAAGKKVKSIITGLQSGSNNDLLKRTEENR